MGLARGVIKQGKLPARSTGVAKGKRGRKEIAADRKANAIFAGLHAEQGKAKGCGVA